VPQVDRPAVRADVLLEAALLKKLLRAVVAIGAKRLQRPEPNRHPISAVRCDVIGDRRGPHDAAEKTLPA
jgi:hypothetical protein